MGCCPLCYQSFMGIVVPPVFIPIKDGWNKGEDPNLGVVCGLV